MTKNKMAQEVTLVLYDGREVSFVGQAFCEKDEIEKLRVWSIKIHPPFELPEDCYFEALKDPKNG